MSDLRPDSRNLQTLYLRWLTRQLPPLRPNLGANQRGMAFLRNSVFSVLVRSADCLAMPWSPKIAKPIKSHNEGL